MNKKTLVRNLVISLAFSGLLGYAVYLFLQYDQFFSSLVRNIILVCIGALFICIWWIFFVDLKSGNSKGDPAEDDDDDESGYGNPDMMGEMDLNRDFSLEDEDEDDLSTIVFMPDPPVTSPLADVPDVDFSLDMEEGSAQSDAVEEPVSAEKIPAENTLQPLDITFDEPEETQEVNVVDAPLTMEEPEFEEDIAENYEMEPIELAGDEEEDDMDIVILPDLPPEEPLDAPEAEQVEETEIITELPEEQELLAPPEIIEDTVQPLNSSPAITFEIPDLDDEPVEVAPVEEPVETSIELPVEAAAVQTERAKAAAIDFVIPDLDDDEPSESPEEDSELSIELPTMEDVSPVQETLTMDLSLQDELSAQPVSSEFDLTIPDDFPAQEPVQAPVEEAAPVEEYAPVEETAPAEILFEEEPAPEEEVYIKPDVNTVNLHELTPEYINLLDAAERKILAARIMREKRRRADLRAQQEAIMRTQELQLYVAQQAAQRAQELAKQQEVVLRETTAAAAAAAVDENDPATQEALRRRQENVRSHEAIIREAAARRAQEEAAQRQAMRAAQQAALVRDAERRAQEQARRQELDRALRLERLRKETERSAQMEAERLAQKQMLEQQEPVVTDSASAIQYVQQLINSEREQRAAQERLKRQAATQRSQEAANLHMLERERLRQEHEAKKLQQQREQLAQLNIPAQSVNQAPQDEDFGITLSLDEPLN